VTHLDVVSAQRLVDGARPGDHLAGTGLTGSEFGEVTAVQRLSGGASRSTWIVELADSTRLIAQIGQEKAAGVERLVSTEVAVLKAASEVGVPVPVVHAWADHDDHLGGGWALTSLEPGEALAKRILRDDAYESARGRFANDCGQALARLHRVDDPSVLALLDETDQIAKYREALDLLGHPSPAFELGLRWLDVNRPDPVESVLVHGDFRLGNLLIDGSGLTAVLDWELAHVGHPMEDLGWLCVRAWRFGGPGEVAGMADLTDLVASYNEECTALGAQPVASVEAVRWWIVLGTLKWGVMCVMQASRQLLELGGSHEHAAIGRRLAENEWDVLELIS